MSDTSAGRVVCFYDNVEKRFLVERDGKRLGRLFRESFEDREVYLELEPGMKLCPSDVYQLARIVSELEIGVEDLNVRDS